MTFISKRTITMIRKSGNKSSKNPKTEGMVRAASSSSDFKSLGLECLQEMRMEGAISYVSQESNQRERNTGALADPSEAEPLKIDKMCSVSSVERVETSDFIGMEFEGGGSLKVEVEAGSITNIYSTNDDCYNPNPHLGTVSTLLMEFIMNCKITELKKDSTTVKGVTYDQQLVFTRDDGNHLTILLSPNAVKRIDYR